MCVFKRFLSPEFIPPRQRTHPLKFFVERKDMIRRRKVLNIPEFFAGRRPHFLYSNLIFNLFDICVRVIVSSGICCVTT